MFGPISALTFFFTRAFNFRGRATRAEYWWVAFALSVGWLVVMIKALSDPGLLMRPGGESLTMALSVVSMALFIPLLSLTVRRLHDTGRSGWWYLIGFVPVIGGIVLLIFTLLRSQDRPNKWGPPRDPMDPTGSDHTAGFATVAAAMSSEDSAHHARSKGPQSSDPWAGYKKYILDGIEEPTAEQLAARKAEIKDYYRRNILKQESTAETWQAEFEAEIAAQNAEKKAQTVAKRRPLPKIEEAPRVTGPIGAFKAFHARAFDFKNVASRHEFWWSRVMTIPLFLISAAIAYAAFGFEMPRFMEAIGGLAVLYCIWFQFGTLSVSVRRLRDAGYSPWLVLLAFVPLGGLVNTVLYALPPYELTTNPRDNLPPPVDRFALAA
jgi:uncharacterized membrane protein YhaH (DUF805 family)